MKVNLTIPLLNIDGEEVQEEGKVVLLKRIAVQALLAESPNEQMGASEKLDAFMLAQKINKAEGEIEIKAEDVALIKKKAAVAMTTLAFGRLVEAVEK